MAIDLSKHNHILKNSFKIGFEVECCIFKGKSNAFLRKIKDLNKKITIGSDGSLKPNKIGEQICPLDGVTKIDVFDDSFELGTPPLPSEQAFILLEQIFELIKIYGYTNKSCGFHVNVSPVFHGDYKKINPFYLANKPLWKEIKRKFKRGNNRFCKDVVLKPSIKRNPASFLKYLKEGRFYNYNEYKYEYPHNYQHKNAISLWHHLIKMHEFNRTKQKFINYVWHYGVISFDNYKPVKRKDSRIEIRGFGNTDYHLKINDIIYYTNKTLALFKESFEKPIEKV